MGAADPPSGPRSAPRERLNRYLSRSGVQRWQHRKSLGEGFRLDDGMPAPAEFEFAGSTKGDRDSGRAEFSVGIREGGNRQVRRMLQSVGHKVVALRRTAFGPLRLGRLKTGGWRVLSEGEVAALRRATGLGQP